MKTRALLTAVFLLLPFGTALQAEQPARPYYTNTGGTAQVRTVAVRRPVRKPRYRRRVVVVRRRPFSHSAAIVGGSAASGAAIGALAGGPAGAAVGALAGGAGGLIYDRATHKKKIVVRR